MTTGFATLRIEDEDGLRWIRFDRARKMNAFDEHQWAELGRALDEAAVAEGVRCIALGSTSGHFSSGYDLPAALAELEGGGPAEIRRHIGRGNAACWKAWHSTKPVIAAVEGYCLGGAFELAMACDFVLADRGASFGEPEARIAASAPFLISPWVMGIRHAKEVLLTGELMTAERAERIGLVNELCEPGRLGERVRAWSRKLQGFPAGIWAQNKMMVNRSYEIMGFSSAIAMGEDAFVELCCLSDPFKGELEQRVKRDGFASAIRWAQSRFE
ncbi:MAG TPA: enoyl-CoA hydratase/isomerase family protein [Hypericibacter adhaerens]|uniref:enoyl-CoA hydratase/isomerase family protein n=1 Tax=Hypericibacter adhaerens TaxID=2602016 RepID=UPI002BA8A9B5|nr:enoyl-CoA hydratase/isomerase family protein [Hypericibacter adhaerens]HWA46515.1 enoyl-CoA hydratase/isomerase family protein [Hypericibacter adhaerens]